ncbi:hypothetical protein OHB54_43880 [Streptomyces sp. NBC_01007]|nr:hypothetical protein OHB54_43880 [Streptomyces sp. NBC_01007]
MQIWNGSDGTTRNPCGCGCGYGYDYDYDYDYGYGYGCGCETGSTWHWPVMTPEFGYRAGYRLTGGIAGGPAR